MTRNFYFGDKNGHLKFSNKKNLVKKWAKDINRNFSNEIQIDNKQMKHAQHH